jgi:short-subunit dehydrogenase
MDLKNARVLLTGASSGIGRELAGALAGRGARLAIAARRRPLLDEVAGGIAAGGRPRPHVLEADLARRGAATELADAAREALGGVDVLINNAGGGVGGAIFSIGDRDQAREAMEVNFWSPLALTAALVPAMRERGRGAVVNVTSGAQVMTWPGFGGYAATKAALGTATETLAMELAGSGVHAMEAVPGPVDTAVQGETRLIPGIDRMIGRIPLGDASVAARRIVRALERGRARVVYPRLALLPLILPTVARRLARRESARVDATLEPEVRDAILALVVRTGSSGDDAPRMARENWERERGRAG